MSVESPSTPLPESNPPDVTQAVMQLRTVVCGLGVALLILSIAFNLFVWKQNRNIVAASRIRLQQGAQQQARLNELLAIAKELANYSGDKPDLMAIFKRYGLEVKQVDTDTGAPAVK